MICQEQYLLAMEEMSKSPRPYALLGQSDSHIVRSKNESNLFDSHYTVAFVQSKKREGILEAIENRYTVAVEETDGKALCYGSLRLVNYCRFLEKAYFARIREERQLYAAVFEQCVVGNREGAEALFRSLAKVRFFDFDRIRGRK